METKLRNDIIVIAAFIGAALCMGVGWWICGLLGLCIALFAYIALWVIGRGKDAVTVPNHILPLPAFGCMNLFGYLLCKDSISEKTLNHENIHTEQMKEMLYVGFYLWYCFEWAYQGVVWFFNKDMLPYHFITFEQEAYENDDNLSYLQTRKRWNWIRYIGKWKKY